MLKCLVGQELVISLILNVALVDLSSVPFYYHKKMCKNVLQTRDTMLKLSPVSDGVTTCDL